MHCVCAANTPPLQPFLRKGEVRRNETKMPSGKEGLIRKGIFTGPPEFQVGFQNRHLYEFDAAKPGQKPAQSPSRSARWMTNK